MKKIDMYRYTSIYRPFDLEQPTNVVILLLSVIILAGGFIFQVARGYSWQSGLAWGLSTSITAFLALAISRETEPQNDLVSYITVALTLILMFYFHPPIYLALVWVVLSLRMLVRTTGRKPKWLDSILISVLTGWLVYLGFWEFAFVGILLFAGDALLVGKALKQLVFAGIHAGLFILALEISKYNPMFFAPSISVLIPVSIVSLLLVATTYMQSNLEVKDEESHSPIHLIRIKTARILTLLLAILVTFWHGDAGFRWIMPLWCALAASAGYQLVKQDWIRRKVEVE